MVSNFQRILAEIRKEAGQVAPGYGLAPSSVVDLVMNIVDLEDRHRVKALAINKEVRQLVENAVQASTPEGS